MTFLPVQYEYYAIRSISNNSYASHAAPLNYTNNTFAYAGLGATPSGPTGPAPSDQLWQFQPVPWSTLPVGSQREYVIRAANTDPQVWLGSTPISNLGCTEGDCSIHAAVVTNNTDISALWTVELLNTNSTWMWNRAMGNDSKFGLADAAVMPFSGFGFPIGVTSNSNVSVSNSSEIEQTAVGLQIGDQAPVNNDFGFPRTLPPSFTQLFEIVAPPSTPAITATPRPTPRSTYVPRTDYPVYHPDGNDCGTIYNRDPCPNNKGSIIGGVIGGVAGLGLIVALFALLRKHTEDERKAAEARNANTRTQTAMASRRTQSEALPTYEEGGRRTQSQALPTYEQATQ